MTLGRAAFKRAIFVLLQEVAREHPLGHQDSKAARFVLTSRDGTDLEIMFEKKEDDPPNIWFLEKAADASLTASVSNEQSPASSLWRKLGKDGKPSYGRHSVLKTMRQLADADLVCFKPETFEQVGQIIDRLLSVTAADLR